MNILLICKTSLSHHGILISTLSWWSLQPWLMDTFLSIVPKLLSIVLTFSFFESHKGEVHVFCPYHRDILLACLDLDLRVILWNLSTSPFRNNAFLSARRYSTIVKVLVNINMVFIGLEQLLCILVLCFAVAASYVCK